VLGALVLTIALFLGGIWLFKNGHGFFVPKHRDRKLRLLEVKSLGGRQALMVVAYEQQRLLIASSPSGVALLTHLPPADPSEPEPEPARAPFAEALRQVLARKP
jgi:flagellar biogenesis protein FliO